jgi:hypothetical protein
MEITLLTINGITPNPTVEFLELCQLAVEVSQSKAHISQLQNKVLELTEDKVMVTLFQSFEFNKRIVIRIGYSCVGEELGYNFSTHEYTPIGIELNPNITAYTLPTNE